MKQILAIVFINLFISSAAFAEKIIKVCKDLRTPPVLNTFTFTIDKSSKTVSGKMDYTDAFLEKNNFSGIKSWTREYDILSINDQSVTFYYNNYYRWKDNLKWVNQTGQSGKKYWNVYNEKSLKKLRKKEGPDNFRKVEVTLNLKSEGTPLYQTFNTWKKKGYDSEKIDNQFLCYSESGFTAQVQKDKEEKTLEASNKIKKEIEPFKNMCRNIGYSEGTEKFADCVKDLYLKKLDADNQSQVTTSVSKPKRTIDPSVWDDLLGVSQGLLGGKSVTETLSGVSSSSSRSKMTCFKTGEETGGLNKICRYDCVGNLVTTTVGAAQMCPIQIQR